METPKVFVDFYISDVSFFISSNFVYLLVLTNM